MNDQIEDYKIGWLTGMFVKDYRAFKAETHQSIDNDDVIDLKSNIELSHSIHKVEIEVDRFTHHICKLVIADNRPRAHKLVDVMDDLDLRVWVRLIISSIKPIAIICFLIGIVWAGVKLAQ